MEEIIHRNKKGKQISSQTKFCKTAPKVAKNAGKTIVSFGAGFVKQTLSNDSIVLPINSRLAMWLDQDWIKKNPAYNKGVFLGKMTGLAQAISEYLAAGLTFTAGTAGSGFADLFLEVGSGGTATPAMAALIATEMALVTAATAAIGKHAGMVMQNSLKWNNYSGSGNSSGRSRSFENKEKLDDHFDKHGSEMQQALNKKNYTKKDYLNYANHVIKEGEFVPEMNGYIKLVGGKGSAKYAFVGLDRKTGDITTFFSITDISSSQMENINYRVIENENNLVSFSCKDFKFSFIEI